MAAPVDDGLTERNENHSSATPLIGQHGAVGSDVNVRWSHEVGQARWIADRLAPFASRLLTSVVPGGFEFYARLLHPAEDARHGERLVRWADVAAWIGVELVPGAQFHEIAILEEEPAGRAPWRGQGPREGALYPGDAAAIVEVMAGHTTTPEHCWFFLWDGYGWGGAVLASSDDDRSGRADSASAPVRVPDPIPAAVRSGPRVVLPDREYLLYEGPIGAALTFVDSEGQTPNLWWPQDRAWCVASEIYLPWTYVGGSAALVASLLAEPRMEAQPATAGESCQRWVTGCLAEVIEAAVAELCESGTVTIETSRGPFAPSWSDCLRTSRIGSNGVSGSSTSMLDQRDEQLREHVSGYLTSAAIELVGG